MIELQGIVKRYVLGGETVLALAGVDLSIGRNEYVALIGPSGSGKSTLMNILGCLDSPTEGRYILNGRDTSSLRDDELATVRNREIGFVFQSFHLLPRQTALQNVMQPLMYRPMSAAERRGRAENALAGVGLGDAEFEVLVGFEVAAEALVGGLGGFGATAEVHAFRAVHDDGDDVFQGFALFLDPERVGEGEGEDG